MINLIVRILQKRKPVDNDRQYYGVACGIAGLLFNITLFILKLIIGTLSGSIAITADAFNNMSDAGSSVITLFGFALSGRKADTEHPYGHGRIEYIAGLIVSLLIILMGFELFISSIKKILLPSTIEFSINIVYVLIFAILIKVYMAYYNQQVGKDIDSATIKAAAFDSLSDVLATSLVLLATLLYHYTQWNIDGYAGLIVAVFILKTGYQSAKDTISPLLGQSPKPEFVNEINRIIGEYPEIIGTHDLIVHDYGAYRTMVSLHAEVSAKNDIMTMHDIINDVEEELKETLQCNAIIHMDPVITDDHQTNMTREAVLEALKQIDERISIHDFRLIKGKKHPRIFFDVVVPFDVKDSDEVIHQHVQSIVLNLNPNFITNIVIDRN